MAGIPNLNGLEAAIKLLLGLALVGVIALLLGAVWALSQVEVHIR